LKAISEADELKMLIPTLRKADAMLWAVNFDDLEIAMNEDGDEADAETQRHLGATVERTSDSDHRAR
jgi:hypothetical protein